MLYMVTVHNMSDRDVSFRGVFSTYLLATKAAEKIVADITDDDPDIAKTSEGYWGMGDFLVWLTYGIELDEACDVSVNY